MSSLIRNLLWICYVVRCGISCRIYCRNSRLLGRATLHCMPLCTAHHLERTIMLCSREKEEKKCACMCWNVCCVKQVDVCIP